MKKILIISLVAVAMCSCGHKQKPEEPKSPEVLQAEAAGVADAEKAIAAQPGTMGREQAILSIRVREQEMLSAGDSVIARAYASAAEAKLDSAGIINTATSK